jgi:hypothetical protein
MYIYIYIEREREREKEGEGGKRGRGRERKEYICTHTLHTYALEKIYQSGYCCVVLIFTVTLYSYV